MSYDVPTKKYPIGGDVDSVATLLTQRQSDAGVTNGGIVASGGSPAVPDLTGNNTSVAYMKAFVDAIMCGVGFQAETNAVLSANNYNVNGVWADIPGTSYTFSAPIAKTYTADSLLTWFMSAGVVGTDFALLRLVVNGTNGLAVFCAPNVVNCVLPPHAFRLSAACAAGSNTIKMQWQPGLAGMTINVNGNCSIQYTIRG
jgi:hypothetical protein